MRVGVVGIYHKLADLKLREQLAKTCQKRFGLGHTFHGDHHFILLSTCNRTEIYFSSEDLATTHSYLLSILRYEINEEFDQKLYSYFGIDCFSHLSRVTSGLDSAIVAETEIQGQVKTAYELAMEFNSFPKDLHFLFQKSLRISKKIRSELQLGRGMPHLEHAVLNTGKRFFPSLENTRILFVGASEINQKILHYLKTKNVPQMTLCNRSENYALKLAREENLQILKWNHLQDWIHYDWIIFGTKSPEYLVKSEEISNRQIQKKLILDLCVPRNVEPKLSLDPRIKLLNIDQINRLQTIRNRRMDQALIRAESMVITSTQQLLDRYLLKEQSKMIPFAVTA